MPTMAPVDRDPGEGAGDGGGGDGGVVEVGMARLGVRTAKVGLRVRRVFRPPFGVSKPDLGDNMVAPPFLSPPMTV